MERRARKDDILIWATLFGRERGVFLKLYSVFSEILDLRLVEPEELENLAKVAITLASLYPHPEELVKNLTDVAEGQTERGDRQ